MYIYKKPTIQIHRKPIFLKMKAKWPNKDQHQGFHKDPAFQFDLESVSDRFPSLLHYLYR